MSIICPDSWTVCALGDLFKFIDYRGKTPNKTSTGIPLITAKNIRDGFINREPREYIAIEDYNSWMTRGIPEIGDIVITTEAPLGNVALIDISEKFALAQRSICLQNQNKIISKFTHFALRSPEFQKKLTTNSTGTTVSGIKASTLKTLTIPIPPLKEQKVIADQLDDMLSKVELIKKSLERIPQILKQFRQSVIADAVSGKLINPTSRTKSFKVEQTWSHEVIGLHDWEQYKLSDLVKFIGGSQPPKSDFSSTPKEGYIRLIQIRDYKSDNHVVYIPINKAKRFVTKDEIMIGRYGPPIFQILRGLEGAYNVALMKAVPDEKIITKEYFYWYLQNYKLFNFIDAGSDRTAGQSGVNKKHLENYPIFVPSIPEQKLIVSQIEKLFDFAEKLEVQVTSAQNKINNLTQSILAKAFRGELTEQWRKDNIELVSGENSAEALLAKIKKEKQK